MIFWALIPGVAILWLLWELEKRRQRSLSTVTGQPWADRIVERLAREGLIQDDLLTRCRVADVLESTVEAVAK